MVPSKEEICHYKHLSLKLYNVLEDIGVSTENRDVNTKNVTIQEILYTLVAQPDCSVYMFGSTYEGTTTAGMGSDTDFVIIPTYMPLATDIDECKDPNGLLLVPDTKPGYVRLQLVRQGRPKYWNQPTPLDSWYSIQFRLVSDTHNRICLMPQFDAMVKFPDSYRQGPAISLKENHDIPSGDFVIALKGETWPDCVAEWLTRRREHGWPSPELIAKCKSLGFLLVPVGHPDSDETEKQFRLSFLHEERILVVQFNSTQLKCYILLKLIKKEFIQSSINEETLTTYHCKTCMFYCMENTSREFWVPENFASCLLMCLRQLVVWVHEKFCPNYFIPKENMFDRIRSNELMTKLEICLYYILLFYNVESLLQNLQFDFIGTLLLDQTLCVSPIWKRAKIISAMSVLPHTVMVTRNHILRQHYNSHLDIFIEKLNDKVKVLEGTETITIHSKEETKEAISLILPFLQLSLLSHRVVETVQERNELLQEILNDDKWDKLGIINSSSKLKQACAMLMLGYASSSKDVLLPISGSDKFSFCGCYGRLKLTVTELTRALRPVEHISHVSAKKLLNMLVQPCVVFLPTEQLITPIAISYEMIRTFGQTHLSVGDSSTYCWYHWGVVEGQFLTRF